MEAMPIAVDGSGEMLIEVKEFVESNDDGDPWVRIKLLPRASKQLEEKLVETLEEAGIGIV